MKRRKEKGKRKKRKKANKKMKSKNRTEKAMDPYEQRKECGEYHRRRKLQHGRVTITHAEVKACCDAVKEWVTQNLDCHDNKCSCNYTHRHGRLVHENRCIAKYIHEMLDNLRDRVADERAKMVAKRSGRRTTKVRFLVRHGIRRPKVPRPWRLAMESRASNAKFLGYKRVVKCKRMSEKRRRYFAALAKAENNFS